MTAVSVPAGIDPASGIDSPAPLAIDVLASVPGWWARRARLAGLPAAWQDWRRALRAPPVQLPSLDADEHSQASPYALGERYVCALPRAARLRHGRHYTPKALADVLWTEIERTGDVPRGLVLDPAAGAGALLLPPLRRFVAGRLDGDAFAAIADARHRFGGIESDGLAAWLGSAVLAAELLPLWARIPDDEREPLPALIRQGDGLVVDRASAGVVVMNPPYGRAALDAQARERWAGSLFGHANWYGIFLHAAVERTTPGGVIAAVLPASFLGGAYYQRLRRFMREHAPLLRLRMIDDRSGVFASGVLQETCLAIFRKGAEPRAVACSAQTLNGRTRSVDLGRALLASSAPDLPWLLPRARSDRALVRAAAAYPDRLSDHGWRASTGPLVWNRHKPQISAERRDGMLPVLWAADVAANEIRPSAARDSQRWIRLRDRDGFMRLEEPAVLVQRTTAPEQLRRLVAGALTEATLRDEWGGAVVVENHVNVLRCSRDDTPLSADLLTALLNSPTLDRLYRCMTGTVAVSAYELEALPLPPAGVLREWAGLPRGELTARIAAAFS
jgi:adenine-specific DNA-methyltransferase